MPSTVKDRPAVVKNRPTPTWNGTPLPLSRMHRFTVEQYHRMIQTGVLTEDDRVELLEGWIVEKMPHNPPHDVCLDLAQNLLASLLPSGWRVRIQSAITLRASEPEPDIALVRGDARRYIDSHPKPDDIAVLVEVADSTLDQDRETKQALYARNGIPVYWIINLLERQVELYTRPKGGRSACYGERKDYQENETIALTIAGRAVGRVPVRELLP